MTSVRRSFLAGAEVVLEAISDERTAYVWDEPSVLEGQTIGSLAGHLARGSVWVVGDYLERGSPLAIQDGGVIDYTSGADYFASILSELDETAHASIRDRGAAIAAEGHKSVSLRLEEQLELLSGRLTLESSQRLISVINGKVMTLDDYLVTRMVEQAVHLIDLADSLGLGPEDRGWQYPPDAADIVIQCGLDLAEIKKGRSEVVRAIFRSDTEQVLPVI